MNPNIIVIDEHTVEVHEAFMSFVPKVFPSIDFRRPFALGGWSQGYRAFSIFEGEQIVANASLQRMELIIDGRAQVGWQFGAVGVLPDWRGRGLQRQIMEAALAQIPIDDFVFLFANEDVLDFYPLFGFRRVTEWLFGIDQCVKPAPAGLRRLSMESIADRNLLSRLAATAQALTTRFGARHYGSVLFWYWANFHARDFYYHEKDDALVIAEQDLEVLRILDVVAANDVDLQSYFCGLVSEPVNHIEFAFTPERVWPSAQPLHEYMESPLFVLGDAHLPSGEFKFPVLAQT